MKTTINRTKKILALVLCLSMLFASLTIPALKKAPLGVLFLQQLFHAHEHYIGDAVENAGDDAHFGIAELCV